ncbi:MAG: hypothetical protein ABMA13_03745 [Chthoniobacteraceae bacterium]
MNYAFGHKFSTAAQREAAVCGRLLLFLALSAVASTAHEPEAQQPFERPHAHAANEARLHAGWESRYASEGRDNLAGDSLGTTSIELGWHHLTAGVWCGKSPERKYEELQLTVGLTETFGPLKAFLAYAYLRFPYADADLEDHEISFGAEWTGLPLNLEVSGNAYYSTMTEGAFIEAGLHRDIFGSDRFSLRGSLLLGVNQGYVPDGHDGANHLAVRLESKFALTKSFAITAHLGYSWALDRDSALPGDAQLIDFLHGSVGMQWSF